MKSKLNLLAMAVAIAMSTLLGFHYLSIQTLSQPGGEDLSNTLLAVSLLITVVMVVALVWGHRTVVKPVEKLEALIKRVRETKDLNLRVESSGGSGGGGVGQHFNEMLAEFHSVLSQVLASSVKVSYSAAELSAITEQTSQGATKQQAESDSVATAMNEMATTVQEVARYAGEAAKASQIADEETSQGRKVVAEAGEGIRRLAAEVEKTSSTILNLEKESENIGTVLNVIQGIAEQTNLLALNAAIEAARAGESGRGFAVVADEVRSLASRSHDSTQEIKTIIERLQHGAQMAVQAMNSGQSMALTSVEQAEAAGASLDTIGGAVTAINEMNIHIASAAEEQSAVAEEIKHNVINITEITGETADAAQATSQTSENMAGLAVELQEWIGKFKLDAKGGSLDLSKAKSAHLAWKTRLRSFLDGKEALSVKEAVSHKHCVLGKWYYSEGLKKFGQIAEMQALETPHAEMHALIREIIELKENGQDHEANEAYRKIDPLSDKIVALLGTVERRAAH